MKRIGVFGGSFDPPHLAHLIIAEQARVQVPLERVLWIPALRSPLKEGPAGAEAGHRLEMVRLAVEGHDGFDVWDGELRRPGPSYTVDTLRALQEAYPDWALHLVIGADSLFDFDRWRDPDGIRRMARLVVYPRPGVETPESADALLLDVPLLEISSTEIRRRIRANEGIGHLVPEAVARYVMRHGLYR